MLTTLDVLGCWSSFAKCCPCNRSGETAPSLIRFWGAVSWPGSRVWIPSTLGEFGARHVAHWISLWILEFVLESGVDSIAAISFWILVGFNKRVDLRCWALVSFNEFEAWTFVHWISLLILEFALDAGDGIAALTAFWVLVCFNGTIVLKCWFLVGLGEVGVRKFAYWISHWVWVLPGSNCFGWIRGMTIRRCISLWIWELGLESNVDIIAANDSSTLVDFNRRIDCTFSVVIVFFCEFGACTSAHRIFLWIWALGLKSGVGSIAANEF